MNTITVDGRQVTCPEINPSDVTEKVFYFHSPEEFIIKTTSVMYDGKLVSYNEENLPKRRFTYAGVIDGNFIRIGIALCKPGESFNRKLGRKVALEIACKESIGYDQGEGYACMMDDNNATYRTLLVHVHPNGKPYATFMRVVRKIESFRQNAEFI